MECHRALRFDVSLEDVRLGWLMKEFRLLVNKSIRIALEHDLRSLVRLTKFAHRPLSQEHAVHKKYIPSAFEVALGTLKAHRRRLRKGRRSSIAFMKRYMLKAQNQSYWLDRETRRLRIPIRGTEGVQVNLPLSEWHRSFLSDSSWGLGSLTIIPGKVIVVVRKEAPPRYEPQAAVTLDANEDSPDGVLARRDFARPIKISFGGARQIQAIHFRRRRRLAKTKAHDRRV